MKIAWFAGNGRDAGDTQAQAKAKLMQKASAKSWLFFFAARNCDARAPLGSGRMHTARSCIMGDKATNISLKNE